MDCKDFEKNVLTYEEGCLKGELLRDMEKHRASCPECARLFQLHRIIFTSLNDKNPVKAPDGLADRILSAAVSESHSTVGEFNTDNMRTFPESEYSSLPVDCKTFEDNVAAYIDGFLKGSLHRAMDGHRISCPSCAHLADVHKTVVASLFTAEMVRAPEGLADRILAAVEGELHETYETAAGVNSFTRYGILAAACASYGSLVAASVILTSAVAKHFSVIGSWFSSMKQVWVKPHLLSVYLNSVWSQFTVFPLTVKTLTAGELPAQWLEVAHFLTEPVQLPFVSLSLPPYYLIALIALVLSAWSYLSVPITSDMFAVSSYNNGESY